jgi:pyrroline-5-carboxylate reductase
MITIIGNGKMALAIAKGLNGNVEVVGRDEKKLKEFCKNSDVKKYYLLNDFDISDKTIILATKPYALTSLSLKGKAKEIISIMAGKKIEEIKKHISSEIYSRAMPNIGAINQASTTAIFGSDRAYEIFLKIGTAIKVNSEKELDIATAIAGSGPAFLALVAEAIADGGVLCGMSRELSYEFTKGLFKSYASLEDKPANIKDSVMSPAGTTASGYEKLEENSVRYSFIKAIKSAYDKSQKI